MRTIIIIIFLSFITVLGVLSFYFINYPFQNSSEAFDTSMINGTSLCRYEIVDIFPHNTDAYTQGFTFEDGIIYEGTGLYGNSSIRKVNLQTGEIIKINNLSRNYFGEGITIFDNFIIQLTWKSKLAFIFDKETLEILGNYSYDTDGWGITHDGKKFIMSDGSSKLYFLDSMTFEKIGTVQVTYQGKPVTKINELEFINGEIFANVWLSDYIARINPKTGVVTSWIDLGKILEGREYPEKIDVLNGIAYNKENNNIFVTGKFWPYVFELSIINPPRISTLVKSNSFM